MIGREILRSKKDARLVQKKLLMSAKWPKAFRVLGARLTSSQLQKSFAFFKNLLNLMIKQSFGFLPLCSCSVLKSRHYATTFRVQSCRPFDLTLPSSKNTPQNTENTESTHLKCIKLDSCSLKTSICDRKLDTSFENHYCKLILQDVLLHFVEQLASLVL